MKQQTASAAEISGSPAAFYLTIIFMILLGAAIAVMFGQ